MSKSLQSYYGEYVGITLLDSNSAKLMRAEIEKMIEEGHYDQWNENALVQLIFKDDVKLYNENICDYEWTEVDCANDLFVPG